MSASYFLGEQWRILDPVASLLIAAFIVISAVQIGRPAINELLEQSLPEDEVMRISDIIKSVGDIWVYLYMTVYHDGVSVSTSAQIMQTFHPTHRLDNTTRGITGAMPYRL